MMTQIRSMLLVLSLFSLFLIAVTQVRAQFDVSDYKLFLESNKNLTADGLLSQYPAGTFLEDAEANLAAASYGNEIDKQYQLTPVEKGLLQKHGFVVTERLSYPTFGQALREIYYKDLPVYVSSDAILHALHISYDAILMHTEAYMLIPKLNELLSTLHNQLPKLAGKYASPQLLTMLKDLDVYLTVTRKLLGNSFQPVYPENQKTIDELLAAIRAEKPANYPLFSSTPRMIDFSQFTVRGHYADPPKFFKEFSGLPGYFQAMIWLGRTEMYLTSPIASDQAQKDTDIQRQTIVAVLLAEAAEMGNVWASLEEIDSTIRFMVGESDNVTLENIRDLMKETGIQGASQLLDMQVFKKFQAALLEKEYAAQRILSQILCSPEEDLEQIEPACAFLLLGQRFAIDSYITANVVYDRIIHNGQKIRRMLPSTLDVLFALGNNASIQLLEDELEKYHYAPNLVSLRYLIDSYDQDSWDSSMYNGWLNSIRTLNPPEDRSAFPSFMQTAAWWQQKMNTQLASWAQLRHDNLLYVKQSYTASIICSYPESFVEPVPEFYDAVRRFAENGLRQFQKVNFKDARVKSLIVEYFKNTSEIVGKLGTIAGKRLDRVPLLQDEKDFLKKMWSEVNTGYSTVYDGWYTKLFYSVDGTEAYFKKDMVVADIHTAPADEGGNLVGWVMHGGTGPINMAIIVSEIDGGPPVAFIGPVMSYYERVTTNFKRLTDQEWETEYAKPPSYRPSFVNLYLADKAGMSRGESISLFIHASQLPVEVAAVEPNGKQLVTFGQIKRNELLQNYPNPFNPETWIPYSLAEESDVIIRIYDVRGQIVRTLSLGSRAEGLYLSKEKAAYWNGKNENGEELASGVYFYTIQAGDFVDMRKMVISR